MLIKHWLAIVLCSRGKVAFLRKLDKKTSVLDVGCGNNSSFVFKDVLPHCKYTGIDVSDYNQVKANLADQYLITSRDDFAVSISEFKDTFDAVVSAHNLEHCDDRAGTFRSMLGSLKPGGYLYLAFPCANSVTFPPRAGTLNYYDDASHQGVPPDYDKIIADLQKKHFEIVFAARRYRPKVLWFVGLLLEPLSRYKKKVLRGTWEYYGFESIIWAKKPE